MLDCIEDLLLEEKTKNLYTQVFKANLELIYELWLQILINIVKTIDGINLIDNNVSRHMISIEWGN